MDISTKRILVTGGAGFLGRAVCRLLTKRGCTEVIVPRRVAWDLTTEDDAVELFDDVRPELVLHLAAEVGGIGANMKTPGRFTYANLAMGLHVIEQCRRFEVEKVVVVGTVCSYPLNPPVPFVESDLWNGYPEPTNAGYGIAKRAIYEVLRQYHKQYSLPGAVVIPTNLYGPHDNFDPASSHVIPAMIRRFCRTDPVTLWGTGCASREFLHVDDAAEGIVRAAETVTTPDPINLGGGGEVQMRKLAEMIAGECGYMGMIRWDSSKPDGQPRRAVDATRASEILGWTPSIRLENGIAETVSWWRDQCVSL
jgi:GDP-L-fucose synthase